MIEIRRENSKRHGVISIRDDPPTKSQNPPHLYECPRKEKQQNRRVNCGNTPCTRWRGGRSPFRGTWCNQRIRRPDRRRYSRCERGENSHVGAANAPSVDTEGVDKSLGHFGIAVGNR